MCSEAPAVRVEHSIHHGCPDKYKLCIYEEEMAGKRPGNSTSSSVDVAHVREVLAFCFTVVKDLLLSAPK